MTGRNDTLLPQSAILDVERKTQIPADPFEWMEILLIGDEANRDKSADSDAAGTLNEASSTSEHTRFVSGVPGHFQIAAGYCLRKSNAKRISVFGRSLRRQMDVDAIGALVELQFRIAT